MRKHPLLVSIGKKIREFRLQQGWSQEELAARATLDRTYIGGIERGERNVSIINLSIISKSLKVSLKELFE
ncbi:helix-turn-helix domain-containing protein [bacterium]|nr:helix-turn-helix domain-containing protein [bacterium]